MSTGLVSDGYSACEKIKVICAIRDQKIQSKTEVQSYINQYTDVYKVDLQQELTQKFFNSYEQYLLSLVMQIMKGGTEQQFFLEILANEYSRLDQLPQAQQISLIKVSLSDQFKNVIEQICAHAQYSNLLKRIMMFI